MSALKYWIWLATRRRLPVRQTLRVLEQFSTPEGAYAADPVEYKLVEGLSAVSAASFSDKFLDRAEEILAACDHQGIRVLTIQDAEYPYCLRQIEDPPCVLYVKGKLPAFDDEAAIAMVGARGATPYGLQIAAGMGMEMARCGALIVSGSARGVDSAALRGALRGGGCVVSVLGNGPDVVYPAQNRDLYADVAAVGALISEYPPGTNPAPEHFPVRNRILSGLSLGVVVVEGTERSGSLITARLALDQGRDVFAVPGNVDAPMSGGPNLLIRR
ncbi:MAG: DNA-protecting protein DprA, partial [Clostridiales bacterium]|nr:DNA-protecting protein DprA [Clostridiales bacterium]